MSSAAKEFIEAVQSQVEIVHDWKYGAIVVIRELFLPAPYNLSINRERPNDLTETKQLHVFRSEEPRGEVGTHEKVRVPKSLAEECLAMIRLRESIENTPDLIAILYAAPTHKPAHTSVWAKRNK